jgi:signal transduction histidine kinase
MHLPAGARTAAPLSPKLTAAILDDLQVVVIQADADLRIVAHGPGLPAYLEQGRANWLGQCLTDPFPELLGSEQDLAEVASGRVTRFDLPMINRADRDGEGRRYLSLAVLPHPDTEGHLICVVQDVTAEGRLRQQVTQQLNEVRLLRSQLEAANQELVRLNDEKSAFLRMAAHDLLTPLTVIRGYVEMVMSSTAATCDEEWTASVHRTGDVVLRRSRQMTDLINNLLDVEKIEAGTVGLNLGPVDLAALIDEVGRCFVPQAKQKGVALAWQVSPACPQLMADRGLLAQALNNLVSNALKFTPSGGRVDIDACAQDGEIVVDVSDTGPGLSEQDQARLFQRFFRTDWARQQRFPGTGLGLSIVKAIVEQHKGQVYCRSQLGQGTTFGFTLPVQER